MAAKTLLKHLKKASNTSGQRLVNSSIMKSQPLLQQRLFSIFPPRSTKTEFDDNTKYNNLHFSHHHPLEHLSNTTFEGEEIECNACGLLISEPYHGCNSCNFYIHEKCLNLPRSLDHPAHPSHPLTLFPTPTYWSQHFTCNACGSCGDGFSFCCAHCEFDLHTHCASHPTRIVIDDHPHELKLIFDWSEHFDEELKDCDVCCGVLHKSFWIYYCFDCQFGSHLSCATRKDRENIIRK
ncbi:hypothetical protein LIER_13757 [Lithospermum erythrorhizon]|uniref:DC1 domain-containing protein n=1 Tax=Lithospermum erythrorhizon TaxID=34254 RepID=A0AAV3Q168_LITER